MPRVIGIDPGTVSIDLCGLDQGRVFLDRSWPTAEALADPARFILELEAAGPLDLVAGPSGYGLPLTRAQDATDEDLRLAFLAAPHERGGIGGLRALVRALARSRLPVVLTPGVVHLPTVAVHRKVNRVDMGTADKVCAVALAITQQARQSGRPLATVSLVLLELGGAFTAAVAVAGGRIVDGVGGTAGPLGFRAPGALDGEVAYLAGEVSKALLFQGGDAGRADRMGGLRRGRRKDGGGAGRIGPLPERIRAVRSARAGPGRQPRDPSAAQLVRTHPAARGIRPDRQRGRPGSGTPGRRARRRCQPGARRAPRDS